MAELTIGDKTVTVDDSFRDLSPEQQQAAVEEIARSIGASGKEGPGVIEDVAKTTPAGLARGTAGLLGMPADAINMVDSAWQWLVSKGLEKTGVWTPEQAQKARQPLPGIEDRSTRAGMPTSKLLVDATEKAIGPLYKPQTTVGEYVNTAAEFAPSAIMTAGTIPQRVAQTFVPVFTSETAGQVARQVAPEWEGTARVAGALTGAVGTAVAQVPRGANVVMRDAVQGATEAEIEAAYQLMDDAANLPGGGVTLTLNDALNQVTNGRMTRLQQLDRVVTNSGGPGAETMAGVYSQRPGQVRATGQAQLDNLAPNPYAADQAAQRGQTAAQGAIQDVRAERSAATRPYYEAASRDTVPTPDVEAVIRRLDEVIANAPTPELGEAARQLRGQLILNPATPGTPAARVPVTDPRTGRIIRYDTTPATPGTPEVPRTNVGELDQVYGQARDDFMGPPVLGETGSAARARNAAGQAIGPLNLSLEAASPSLRQGRAVHQQMTNDVVLPAEQGPLGRINNIDPGAENASARMGEQLAAPGVDRYHDVVAQSVQRLSRRDPRAAETLARDYVGDVLNQATRDLQGGANVYGGAKFFQRIAGDEASLRNLEAMVSNLPNGAQRWAGFHRFLDVVQATSYKAQKGSDTAFNQAIQQQMREGGAVAGALEGGAGAAAGAVFGGGGGSAAGGLMGIRRALSDRLMRWRMDRSSDQVAWMLTSREAAPILRQLANAPAGGRRAATLALRLTYLGERELQRPEQTPVPQPR